MKYIKTINEFFYFKPLGVESEPYDYRSKQMREFYGEKVKEFSEKYTDDDWDKILNILKNECGGFLKEFGNGVDPLFRGSDLYDADTEVYKQIRRKNTDRILPGMWVKESHKRRKPKDMSRDISNMFDDEFRSKTGYSLRSSGVFATKSPSDAKMYGKDYMSPLVNISYNIGGSKEYISYSSKCYLFFPIGDYKYFWNPKIRDLYSDIDGESWYGNNYDWDDDSYLYEIWFKTYGDPEHHGGGTGQYDLNGVPTRKSRVQSVIDLARKSPEIFNLPVDGSGQLNISDDELHHMIKWVNGVEYDDFLEEREAESRDNTPHEIATIVDGYQEGGIEDIKEQEITFICDRYYLVDDAFYPKMLEYIKSMSL